MAPIVLLTDFGTKDGHVGVMKGVILTIAPEAQIIDLSHGIQPQNIEEAALILSRTYRYFPIGSIFIVVIDPGVGTTRRPIALWLAGYYFILPDNGIITPILMEARTQTAAIEIVHLNNPAFWNENISSVFHGRDIFAPVGAHLANGIDLMDMGVPIQDPVLITLEQPKILTGRMIGKIIHIDHFGNLTTNIRREHLANTTHCLLNYKDYEITGLYTTFGDSEAGTLILLIGSTDYLLIARVNGNAAAYLAAVPGDRIVLNLLD